MNKLGLATLSLAIIAPVGTANAALITHNLEVTAGDFFSRGDPNAVPPIEVATLQFSLKFDNNADINASTDGLTIFSNSLPYSVTYSYRRDVDMLSIGTETGPGTCGFTPGEDVFCFFLFDASNVSPTIYQNDFQYQVDDVFFNSGTFEVRSLAGAVPEPATWGFMILGFGVIGGAMRRQHKANVKVSYA